MQRLVIAALSLGLSLSGAVGIARAQEKAVEGIVTNADGANVRSTAGVNPTANGEGGTLIYGDITTGPGYNVIGAPAVVNTSPAPAATSAPAAEPAADAPAAIEPAPVVADTAAVDGADGDGDNYADALEVELGLDPNSIDTDVDGVADGDEINIYGTDPLTWDSDGDGVSDGNELFDVRTDPLVWTDFDADSGEPTVEQVTTSEVLQQPSSDQVQLTQDATVSAKEAAYLRQQGTTEILTATDGNASALGTGDASASPGTVTRDGVTVPSILGPDGTYSVNEVSPPTVNVPSGTDVSVEPASERVAEPAPVAETVTEPAPETTEVVASEPAPVAAEPAVDSTDLDGDNYADALEVELGLDPTNIDTDADGVADGDELNIYGTDPFTADSDGDGVLDGAELYDTRTDPLVWTDFSVAASTETVEQEPAVQEGM
jgi:hypothetical protein